MLKGSIKLMLDCLLSGRIDYISQSGTEGRKCRGALLPMSSHHYIECAIVFDGSARINFPDKAVELIENRLLVILPETSHCEGYIRKSQPYSILWAAISPGGVGFFMSNYRCEKGRESGKRFGTIFSESHQLWKASQMTGLPDDILVRGRFVSSLVSACVQASVDMDKSTFCENEYHKQMVMQIKSYLDVHFTGDISLSEVAQMVRHSPNYTNFLFRKFAGKPIREYVVERRLAKACTLLKTTDLQLKKIAQLSGFNDQLYFSRMFRSHYNCSPADWRKRRR